VIYALELKERHWYIGKTYNVEQRFQEHIAGNDSSWTQMWHPISDHPIILKENASIWDEDIFVKEYTARFYIDNVRGGCYVSTILILLKSYFYKEKSGMRRAYV
jgi:hypothetical protein